jgi:hypothetical protein
MVGKTHLLESTAHEVPLPLFGLGYDGACTLRGAPLPLLGGKHELQSSHFVRRLHPKFGFGYDWGRRFCELRGYFQYFTMPPHSIWNPYGIHMKWIYSMESIWNPCGMDIFHGIHMESMWNMFGPFMEYVKLSHGMHVFHMYSIWNGHLDSTWIPCSFHMDSIWIPCSFHRIFPHGFHLDSRWNRDLII